MPKRQSAGAGGSTLLGIEERRASARSGSTALDRWLTRRILAEAGHPPVAIELWDGACTEPPSSSVAAAAATPDLVARMEIRDRRTLYGLLVNSDVAFGDAISADRIRVHGDLVTFLETIYRSTDEAISLDSRKHRFKAWLNRPRRNTRAGSRSNIHHHYDLGNDFYRLWLDEEMVYTCAYYPHENATLEEAQQSKMDDGPRLPQARAPGRAAGGGGGVRLGLALAIHMARRYGAQGAGVQHLPRADPVRTRTRGGARARRAGRVRGGRLPHRRRRVRRIRLGRHAGARGGGQLPHARGGGRPFPQAGRPGPHPLHRTQCPGPQQRLDRAAHLPGKLSAEPRGDEHDLRAPGVLHPRRREPAPALRPDLPRVAGPFRGRRGTGRRDVRRGLRARVAALPRGLGGGVHPPAAFSSSRWCSRRGGRTRCR